MVETKTIILEQNRDLWTRVRTQCNDQNYVRDYYMTNVSVGGAIAACAYLLDMLMDMNLILVNTLQNQLNLTTQQQATLQKLNTYHSKFTTDKLQDDTWEMDWVYGEVKYNQYLLSLEFFKKRAELQLGDTLPDPVQNDVS